jgi:hypothetical protein
MFYVPFHSLTSSRSQADHLAQIWLSQHISTRNGLLWNLGEIFIRYRRRQMMDKSYKSTPVPLAHQDDRIANNGFPFPTSLLAW